MSGGQVVATAAVVIGSLLVSAGGGLWLVPAVLRSAARTRDGAADDDTGPTSPDAVLALRGGTWIGLLERVAVTGCVVAGFPSGVAVVVAVKGLGRYPEIRDNPGVSERFVVGTLASLVWAGFVGWLGLWALGRIG